MRRQPGGGGLYHLLGHHCWVRVLGLVHHRCGLLYRMLVDRLWRNLLYLLIHLLLWLLMGQNRHLGLLIDWLLFNVNRLVNRLRSLLMLLVDLLRRGRFLRLLVDLLRLLGWQMINLLRLLLLLIKLLRLICGQHYHLGLFNHVLLGYRLGYLLVLLGHLLLGIDQLLSWGRLLLNVDLWLSFIGVAASTTPI